MLITLTPGPGSAVLSHFGQKNHPRLPENVRLLGNTTAEEALLPLTLGSETLGIPEPKDRKKSRLFDNLLAFTGTTKRAIWNFTHRLRWGLPADYPSIEDESEDLESNLSPWKDLRGPNILPFNSQIVERGTMELSDGASYKFRASLPFESREFGASYQYALFSPSPWPLPQHRPLAKVRLQSVEHEEGEGDIRSPRTEWLISITEQDSDDLPLLNLEDVRTLVNHALNQWDSMESQRGLDSFN